MDRIRVQLLADLGGLADAVTQIVQLGAAHETVTHGLDGLDRGRMYGEHLLHAHTVGDTADGDGLLDAAMLLGNNSTLENLNTLAGAFLDLHMHADGIAHLHLRHFLQLLFVQCFDEIHGFFLLYL